ncbi:MAG: FxLYD domain-containing protein, partial [Chloroflexi bacterium]|nr:FxLYD domain-containing protein [Chloroflexota bacterium]
MTLAKLLKRTFVIGPILGAVVGGAVLIGCASGADDGRINEPAVATQETSEQRQNDSRGEHDRNGEQGREAGGEHGSRGESGGETGQHNEARERGSASGDSDGGEASRANALARDATFDEVRGGARLILKFDDASNSFRGIVENTSDRVLTRVRVEVHLDNGAELGPTTPTDLAPGETLDIVLPSTPESFTAWTTPAEV